MKKILLIILLFSFTVSFAQKMSRKIKNELYASPFLYTPLPSAPTLTAPQTITYASPGSGIINAGTSRDKIMSGLWQWAIIQGLVGTAISPYRIVNNSTMVIGGGNGHALSWGSTSTHFKFYGLSPTEPFIIDETGFIDTQSGVQINAIASPGTVMGFYNNVIKETNYAGYLINNSGTLSGGSVSTPPTSNILYGSIDIAFSRMFGKSTEGEGIYIGNTSRTAYAIINDCQVDNVLVYNKGREGIQLSNCVYGEVTNCTVNTVGQGGLAQHQYLSQFYNGTYLIQDCIFVNAPDAIILASHDIIFRNCYFSWSTNANANIIQDYYTEYNTSSRLTTTPFKILFENCVFNPTVTNTYGFYIYENDCNIEFKDCVFSNRITTLYQDLRGGSPANTITGTFTTNGNSVSSSIQSPTFTNFNASSYTTQGLLTNRYYYNRGMGYRTP